MEKYRSDVKWGAVSQWLDHTTDDREVASSMGTVIKKRVYNVRGKVMLHWLGVQFDMSWWTDSWGCHCPLKVDTATVILTLK